MADTPLRRALTGFPAVQEPRDAPRSTQTTVINIRERLRQIEEQLNLIIASVAISGDPFPEAPADGYIYGRRNRAWTRTGGQPAPPPLSVQWNNGGNFGGSPELLFDYPNRTLIVGAYPRTDIPEWTIKPQDVVNSSDNGIDLTIEAGSVQPTTGAQARGGNLTLYSGYSNLGASGQIYILGRDCNQSGVSAGHINIIGGAHTLSGGTVSQYGGTITITGGASSSWQPGSVNITGGEGTNPSSGAGGDVRLQAGTGANTGGTAFVTGGTSLGNPGGPVNIAGGTGSAGNGNGVVQIGTQLSLMKSGLTTIRGAPLAFNTTGATAPVGPAVGNLWGLADSLWYHTNAGSIELTGGSTINGLTGQITLQAGPGIAVAVQGSGNVIEVSNAGVLDLNGLVGQITLQAGANISLTNLSGNVIEVASTSSGASLLVDDDYGILFDDSGDVLYES